ncbi:MAG: FadR family transcriptional regulator [Rhodobacteraceae bacterium]|nr:FadR family transcriptional regulator [Paracoccaceae bacterium]
MEYSPKPIRIGSAEIATDLRQQIHSEELQHLERLPSERVFSKLYNVSRGTVRDALMRLEREGLVEIRQGSGTYVVYSTQDQAITAVEGARPLELVDARFALEPHICRLAVLHARRPDFEKMEVLLEKMETCADDPVAFGEADTAFHAALVESTGNNLLVWLISQINSVRALDEWTRMRHLTLERSIVDRYNVQHRKIVNAIRSREPERAATLMKEHLETARLSLTRAADT